MAADSVASDRIYPKFKLIEAFMVVLARMKINANMGMLVWSQHFSYKYYGIFSRHTRAAISAVPSQILLNFEHIQEFMAVIV